MAERWTKQRRLEHTRNVLLDPTEEVLRARGLTGPRWKTSRRSGATRVVPAIPIAGARPSCSCPKVLPGWEAT